MIFQPKQENKVLLVVLLSVIVGVDLLFVLLGLDFVLISIFTIISGFIVVRYFVTTFRTICMNEQGCTISLWNYRRTYLWEELSMKRLEGEHLGLRIPYHSGGVFFSVHPVKKPRILDPCEYCMFMHPLTCFYVYFSPNVRLRQGYDQIDPYVAERKAFLHLLETWGVELES